MGDSSLIVNADDFGRTPGVTEGILRGHHDGVVTSTTAMVNLPHAEGALRRAWAEAPELGTGVHLNLTAGRPVLPAHDVPSLVEGGGQFLPIRSFVARRDGIDVGQVRAELQAQIERFCTWGREPTHLDAHHHSLYLAPRLFRVLVELAAEYGLPVRYPWPREPLSREALATLAVSHRVGVAELPDIIAGCQTILEASRVTVPRRCLLTFYGAQATRSHLLELIASLPAGVSELMCHPGVADAPLRASSGYAEQREEELAVLTDPGVRDRLREAGVRLLSFRFLPSFGPVP